MGFSEDDRIRRKNLVSNKAHEIYDSYRAKNWSHSDIAVVAELELKKDPTNVVNYEVLKMATRLSRADRSVGGS